MNPAEYSVRETLRDGSSIEIRALRPADREALVRVTDRMSPEARQLRFFTPKRSFTEAEIDYFVNVDFVAHVALVAVRDEAGGPRIVGGGRYILAAPGRAEVAFGVDEAFQGQGIAGLLLRHIVILARDAGLHELFAEVLPENGAMLKVFHRSGLAMRRSHADGVVHVSLALQ